MRTNIAASNPNRTHEGGAAAPTALAPLDQLIRQVATCMLFEGTFYESGSEIATSIATLSQDRRVSPQDLAALAVRAREEFKLRHVPLFLLAMLDMRRAEAPGLVASTVRDVVRRPDEMAELLSLISKVNGKPLKKALSAQVKKGLARAFTKFSEYQLAKWDRKNEIRLRDVLFLVHAKPKSNDQAALWKKLVDDTLPPADTWEVALSAGADKKAAWERLLSEGKLGYTALLMNLRNMTSAGVDAPLVEQAIAAGAPKANVLPFKFLAAAKAAPQYAAVLSDAMVAAIDSEAKLPGVTHLVVDVSGSMDSGLSSKSVLTRLEAAGALAILLREVCESVRVFTFSNDLVEVANHRGIALHDALVASQPHGGTYLSKAIAALPKPRAPRTIVVTDEQSHDGASLPADTTGYLINVAPYKPALAVSGSWTRISGFSERIVDYVRYAEGLAAPITTEAEPEVEAQDVGDAPDGNR